MVERNILTWRQKKILFTLVCRKIRDGIPIPRSSCKLNVNTYTYYYDSACKQTNYILEAIGEKYEA